jgi:hypothetical protein
MVITADQRIPARYVNEWIVGADLGQSTDPTAICVLNHRVMPLDTWTKKKSPGLFRQDRRVHFDVRH